MDQNLWFYFFREKRIKVLAPKPLHKCWLSGLCSTIKTVIFTFHWCPGTLNNYLKRLVQIQDSLPAYSPCLNLALSRSKVKLVCSKTFSVSLWTSVWTARDPLLPPSGDFHIKKGLCLTTTRIHLGTTSSAVVDNIHPACFFLFYTHIADPKPRVP